MKICGGQNDDGAYTGIFVKRILLGGAVASDGSLLNFCNMLFNHQIYAINLGIMVMLK